MQAPTPKHTEQVLDRRLGSTLDKLMAVAQMVTEQKQILADCAVILNHHTEQFREIRAALGQGREKLNQGASLVLKCGQAV